MVDAFPHEHGQADATCSNTQRPTTGKHAKHMRDKVVPAMATLRELGDPIELMVPHELWPLPTYREMLFIK